MQYLTRKQRTSNLRKSRKPRKYKVLSGRNSKYIRKTMKKKQEMSYKEIKEMLDNQIKLQQFALQEDNLEIYAYSNKIIIFLILDLLSSGSKKKISLANGYIKLPSVRDIVKSAKNSYHKPPSSGIAPGWVWE